MTKPERSLSKGIDARSGSAAVVSAPMLLKPVKASGVMAASDPPVMQASRTPYLMFRKASPTAWEEVAQAVTGAKLAPLNPVLIEILPAAMLAIIIGMKKTETRLGPFWS